MTSYLCSGHAWAHPGGASCRALDIPVAIADIPGATIHGELCTPPGRRPHAVQLLVHGADYDHVYFDWPFQPEIYSYVRYALAAGFATFNIDRLGAGASTRPPAALDNLANQTAALTQVITGLRDGTVAGRGFGRVVWVSHSYGSLFGWLVAQAEQRSQRRLIDAYVLTGIGHQLKGSWFQSAIAHQYPAVHDPKFADAPWAACDPAEVDQCYFTTIPGASGLLWFDNAGADSRVVAINDQLKDVASFAMLIEGTPLFQRPPPASAPSRAIRVPTLLVDGEEDNLFCGPPDGADCSRAGLLANEGPYYAPEAQLQVLPVAETGHSLQLHESAPMTALLIQLWIHGQLHE